jgi:Prephenate dehydratase
MSEKIIAFQGEIGANSHIACSNVYPDWTPLPCATFEDAFFALTEGQAELAMIPIENSLAGRVADIHTLLPSSKLFIIGEYFLPIHFQLVATENANLGTIKNVYSHIHALGQCRKIIRKLGLRAHVAADTAGAAKDIAQLNDPTKAALATRLAAEIYGLQILAEDVEDATHNTTRFIFLSRSPDWPLPHNGPVITSFVFRTRNIPAALYKALGGFATNGINMSKLESYMVGGEFAASQFYVEVEGHPEEPALKRALEELTFFSKEVNILGVFPQSEFRKGMKTSAE